MVRMRGTVPNRIYSEWWEHDFPERCQLRDNTSLPPQNATVFLYWQTIIWPFFSRISSGWDFASEELPGLPEELPSPKGGRTADAAPLLGLKNCFRGRFGTCACLFYPLETALNCANHSYRLKWPNFRSMICETMVIHHPFGKCWSPHDAKSLEWSLVRESVAK